MSTMPPAAKRQRQDDGAVRSNFVDLTNSPDVPLYQHPGAMPVPWPPGTHLNAPSAAQMLYALDDQAVRTVLSSIIAAEAPTSHTHALLAMGYQEVLQRKRALVAQEQARSVSFAHYADKVDFILNAKYNSLSGSQQYEMAWDAKSQVTACIETIQGQVKPESSFGTKVSALETLEAIGDSILGVGDTLGSEVLKQFQYDDCLPAAMLAVMGNMTAEECVMAGEKADGAGTLATKVQALIGEANGRCVGGFDTLETVHERLLGGEDYDEEEGDDEEEEDEEEDEEEEEGPEA